MRRKTTWIAVLLLTLSSVVGIAPALGAPDGCSYPVSATDATGTEVTVADEPERIVSLNPSAAQTLWEIGAKEKVVGVSQFAGFLEGASKRRVVTKGFPSKVQLEEVIKLEPDLVLAPNTISNETVSRLRQAGITVFRFAAAKSIEDVYEKTINIGKMAGKCEAAKSVVAEMKEEINTVRQAVSGEDRPRVLYAMSGGYAPSPNTFIGAMIEAAGGKNIVANANSSRLYPKLSGEFIVQQDPEWLVVSYTPKNANKSAKELLPKVPALKNTTAFQKGQIVKVNANNISQPAPRIVQPIKRMAKAFHPNAYAEAKATATPTSSPTDASTPGEEMTETSPTVTTSGTAMDDDESESPTNSATETPGQAGFGVALAVLAVLVVAFRRRSG